ncbi:MAG TPA: methyltransferase domain-containing protein [Solirubrobacteraceae bacterium]|jgi:trans-aconitate 2-methyltransferase|nr:methyltransferase domain-containing protein [Solirubrobacteraceae bacterium]
MPRDWNAASYDQISAPQQEWGAAVVARLALRGDETVLDAGAGTGRVTEMVLERLPDGHVIAVDGSPSMCETARERLPAQRTTVICSDLLDLTLSAPADAIVSTATFHWIRDHDALFARMRAAVRDGGQFVAQCGGEGNIDRVRGIGERLAASAPYAEHLATVGPLWNYASVEATQERLRDAGFDVAACWLQPMPARPPRPREFLETVIFGPYIERLPDDLRERFLDQAMEALGAPVVLDYVRLNWDAVARTA